MRHPTGKCFVKETGFCILSLNLGVRRLGGSLAATRPPSPDPRTQRNWDTAQRPNYHPRPFGKAHRLGSQDQARGNPKAGKEGDQAVLVVQNLLAGKAGGGVGLCEVVTTP